VLSYLLEYALGTSLNWQTQDLVTFRTRLLLQVFRSDYTLENMVIKQSDLNQKLALTEQAVLVTPRISRKHQMSPSPPANSAGSQPPSFAQVLEKNQAKRVKVAPFPFKPTITSGSPETLNTTTRALFASTDKLMDWEPQGNEDSAAEMKDAGEIWSLARLY
jgi:hypothetical protein